MSDATKRPEAICLACGLCCDGTIFARVKLQPEDDLGRLESLGLTLVQPRSRQGALPRPGRRPHFNQPCAALEGCRCRIYEQRPCYCRQFECLLLKGVKEGRTGTAAALRTVRAARASAQRVRRLLRALGDTDEHLAPNARFRRTGRRLEQNPSDPQAAETFGKLTLAVHELNLLLSQRFYPGSDSLRFTVGYP